MLPQALIWLTLLLAATTATQYECVPFPTCIIHFINYQPGGDSIAFPTGYQHYRITSNSETQMKSHVAIFDEVLYEAMHQPSIIEMKDVAMKNLTLPPALYKGIFAKNNLRSVTIEAGKTYQISQLDLESNNLVEIAFVSSLVNLAVLRLGSNQISTIPDSAFTPLTKLKFLHLEHNKFKSIPWSDLPRSLIYLFSCCGHVESVDFTNVSLPLLEYLSLEHNTFATINVTALIRAAPHLDLVHLYNSKMTEHEINQIDATLTSHKIGYGYRSEYEDEPSHPLQAIPPNQNQISNPVDVGMAILLSVVNIGLVAAFVYIVVLAYRHMNR